MLYWIIVALSIINILISIFTMNWLAVGGWTIALYGHFTLATQNTKLSRALKNPAPATTGS